MIYILLMLLLVQLLLGYIINGRDIMSAWLISISMFIISATVYACSMRYFGEDISAQTVLVIVLSLLCWGLGEITYRLFFYKKVLPKKVKTEYINNQNTITQSAILKQAKPIEVSIFAIFIVCIFIITITVLRFQELYIIANRIATPSDFFQAIEYARYYLIYNEYSVGPILSHGSELSMCCAFFFSYVFLYNRINHRKSKYVMLLPTLLYAIQLISSTNRTGYIKLITVICIIGFILMKQKVNWNRKVDGKIVKFGIMGIVSFIILFRLIGYTTGVSELSNVWYNIAKYISASILGLDRYLEEGASSNILFGQNSLRSIYLILREWGVNIPWYSPHNDFFKWANGSANIYTGLKGSIEDFTFIGMLITRYLLGIIYAFIIMRFRNNNKNHSIISIVFCGIFFYPIAMTAIADVYSSIISISLIYDLIYLKVISWLFINNFSIKSKQIRVKMT
ncbi:MAG: O-antigen polymerase [Bacillota bacterium]